MEFRDYYATLGVARNADEKAIRTAYRKLARELHPDVNKDPKATERFKRVNEAYEVLKDPKKRAKYDQLGADWENIERAGAYRRQQTRAPFGQTHTQGGRAGGRFGGFSDFFETFFGGHGDGAGDSSWVESQLDRLRREQTTPRKGHDTEDTLEIGLEEAMTGAERTMHISIMETCPTCGGSGQVAQTEPGGGTAVQTAVTTCPTCAGTGRQYLHRTLRVTVPKGVTEGSKIRVAGEGASGQRGGSRGDLYLKVHLKLGPGIEVKARSVYQDLAIRDYRAALGGKVVADGPAGKLQVTVPAGCPSGRVLRIPGKGIPALKAGGQAGDLFLRVKVQAATDPSGPEREAYTALARSDGQPD